MPETLSEQQTAALFDILTHYNTYAEIRDFRTPGSLDHYGPPFSSEAKKPSTSPALQTLVSRYLLNMPGLKDLPEEFWKVQVFDIIESLEKAELSESYEKGIIGSRKTLATAIAALIEYPVRGTFGGFAKVDSTNSDYDTSNADDLGRAFRDFLDQCVYGDVLEQTVKTAAKTDQLSEHNALIQAVHEYVLVNIASLLHYTLVLTPKGQYLVKLIDNINKLIPYVVVRQTLRIGNVASMINGMVKVGLAKMSVASFTNWMGLTAVEDEGMNLMQSIISTVLSWDTRDLESRASKIEKEKNSLSKEQLQALREYGDKTVEDHKRIRELSFNSSISIVLAILTNAEVPSDMSESVHQKALDYLSIQLSIRDRKEITRILCHSIPDHLTTSVRQLVSAFEPNIRQLHEAVDLADGVYDFQLFLSDMLKLAKVQPPGKDGKTIVPTVGDFVQLLKKHQYSCHKFIHQCCKNGGELTGWYLAWSKEAASQFKRNDTTTKMQTGAGDLSEPLNQLFRKLPQEDQENIVPILDAQIKYLAEMHSASTRRLESVISSAPSKNPVIAKIVAGTVSRPPSRGPSRPGSRANSPTRNSNPASANNPSSSSPLNPTKTGSTEEEQQKTQQEQAQQQVESVEKPEKSTTDTVPTVDSDPGPGAFLARWQDLLEATSVTPVVLMGDPRSAVSQQVLQASATDVDGIKTVNLEVSSGQSGSAESKGGMQKVKLDPDSKVKLNKPDAQLVVEALADGFRALLAEQSLTW